MERSGDSQVLCGGIDSEAPFLAPICVPQATPQGRLIYSSADLPGGPLWEPNTVTSQGQRRLCGAVMSVRGGQEGGSCPPPGQGALPPLPAVPSGLRGSHSPPMYTANSQAGLLFMCLCAFHPWGGVTPCDTFLSGHMSSALYIPLTG